MTAAHIHLWLNHVPVVGVLVVLVVLAAGVARRDRGLVRLAGWLLVALAIVTIPVYLSGERAEGMLEGAASFSHDAVEAHEEAALVALAAMEGLGVLALGILALFRRRPAEPGWALGALLAATALVAGILVWTAYLGGQVNHPELRPGWTVPRRE